MHRTRWWAKPQLGTPVDRTHPIGSRLIAAWLFQPNAGPYESISGTTGSFSNTGYAWQGEDLVFNGSQYATLASSSSTIHRIGANQSFTVVSRARLTSNANTNYAGPFCTMIGGTASIPGWAILQSPSGAGDKVYAAVADGVSVIADTFSATPTFAPDAATHDYAFILDRRAATLTFCVDGAAINSVSASGLGSVTPTSALYSALRDTGAGQMACRVRHNYIFDGALTLSQLRSLFVNPYQIFARPRVPFYAAASAGGAFNPYLLNNWQGGYQVMVGGYNG